MILSARGLTKRFPGVTALRGVDLEIEAGEVHVLVGENGAGKSCLIKILCGTYLPDGGEMVFDGRPYAPQSPADAIAAGIRVVYQEFNLLTDLSVAENIFFERLPGRFGLVDFGRLYRDAERLLRTVGLDIPVRLPVGLLGIAQMQLVEIAKALSAESRLVILDEPTATLTSKEIENLFRIIRRLKERGVTLIYISHRLQEIFQIGDRVTVLRNGVKIGTRPAARITIPEIVKMMVGREMEAEYPFDPDLRPGDEVLRVQDLGYRGNSHRVSFALRAGELLGVAGLVGSGRTETARAIFGADPRESGRIFVRGREVGVGSPRDAIRHGICLLTEDRKGQGLILDMSCAINITVTDLARVSRAGLIRPKEEQEEARRLVDELAIKTPSLEQWVRFLSGGNQQKIVLAKWLFRNADILILDEPTRGIDVGAKYEIYLLLWRLAAAGKGILIISSDLPELLGICHRLLVFSNGRITGELERAEFDQGRILSLAYQEYIGGQREP